MGYSVLLSNYRRYFKLASYLATHTREPIVIAMGMPSLEARPLPPVGRCADEVLFRLGAGVAPLEAHACCGSHLLARTFTPQAVPCARFGLRRLRAPCCMAA